MTAAGLQVADEPELLALMIRDSEQAGDYWVATAYWRSYVERIRRELDRHGLQNFRTNYRILKGFAHGGVPLPTLPRAAWKRAIWQTVARLPVFSLMLREHQRLVAAEHAASTKASRRHARLVLDRIADRFPSLEPPAGIANGGAGDAFAWRGHTVTSTWVLYLARLADFYASVDPKDVRSILEIGPGLGLSSLAHIAINPALKTIVNVDIPPVAYVSTCFLKSVPALDVRDYASTQKLQEIRVGESSARVIVHQLLPWQLPKVRGAVDFAFNAYSFQEMEKDVCANYARFVCDLATGGVMLHSTIAGHKDGAGDQMAPVTLDYLSSLFENSFPSRSVLGGFWTDLFEETPESTALLQP